MSNFFLLFLLWLTGTVILWTGNYKTPFIIISGAILLRSFLIEKKGTGGRKDTVSKIDE